MDRDSFEAAPWQHGQSADSTRLLAEQYSSDPYATALENKRESTGSTSIFRSTFNICNIIIGSGIIGLPYAMRLGGLGVGLGLLVLIAIITDYSLRILVEAGRKVGKFDYEELSMYCFGRWGFFLVLLIIFIMDYGTMIAYLVVIGDTVTPVLITYAPEGDDWWKERWFCVLVPALLFVLPLSLFRNLAQLSYVSIVSVCSVIIIITVVGYDGLTGDHVNPDGTPIDKEIVWFAGKAFSSFGIITFAYVCHDVSFQVFQSLRNPTPRRWSWVIHFALGIAFSFSAAMALLGYLSFYQSTEGNIINALGDGVFANIARIILACTMFMTFPMNLFMSRHVVARLIGYESAEDFSFFLHVLVTLLLFSTSLGIGMVVDDLGIVMAFVGGFAAVAIAFIIPALSVLIVRQRVDQTPWLSVVNIKPITLCIFGVAVAIMSTTQTTLDLFDEEL